MPEYFCYAERGKFRELIDVNPFRWRRILTPQQIKELYDDDDDAIDKDKKSMDDDDLIKYDKMGTHEIWKQDPDNVYEIIQLLRELGFKSNQNSTVWPCPPMN